MEQYADEFERECAALAACDEREASLQAALAATEEK